MENLLLKYYKTLSALKSQQQNMQTIYMLESFYADYERVDAISFLSAVLFKYAKEINLIAGMMNKPYIQTYKNVNIVEEYNKEKKQDDDILHDISFAVDCLIIIFAVDSGIATSIPEVINQLKKNVL